MRSRNIKPGFFKSEGLASCSVQARLLFIGLWCMADREGKLEDRPLRIKAELFPYDNVNIDKLLDELASKKDCDGTPSFIVRYGTQKKYIQIIHFLSHQNPHIKEQQSVIPDFTPCTVQVPDEHRTSMEQAVLIPDSLNLIPDIPLKVQAPCTPQKKRTIVDEYYDMFLSKYNQKPAITGKHGKLLNDLVKQLSTDEVIGRLKMFFDDTDKFVVDSKHDVSVFQSRVNRYVLSAAPTVIPKPTSVYTGPKPVNPFFD